MVSWAFRQRNPLTLKPSRPESAADLGGTIRGREQDEAANATQAAYFCLCRKGTRLRRYLIDHVVSGRILAL
jgi:hypothetical protein